MRGANHDQVLRNVSGFLESRRQRGMNGPIIETIFYSMPENEHEQDTFVQYWRGLADHARLGGGISQAFSGYKSDGKTVALRTRTCSLLWERMAIFWNGDVPMCPEDVDGDWVLGNLTERSIAEIWNGERLLSIKRSHKDRRFESLPLCLRCDW